MKRLLFTLVYSFGFLFAGCLNAQTADVKKFEQGLKGEAQLLDVRTPEEYDEGHLKNAVLMNVNDDAFEKNISSLDKNKPVYVYCRSGKRSSAAASILKEKGFNQVIELKGGITAWQDAGKEMVSSPEKK